MVPANKGGLITVITAHTYSLVLVCCRHLRWISAQVAALSSSTACSYLFLQFSSIVPLFSDTFEHCQRDTLITRASQHFHLHKKPWQTCVSKHLGKLSCESSNCAFYVCLRKAFSLSRLSICGTNCAVAKEKEKKGEKLKWFWRVINHTSTCGKSFFPTI